MLYNKEKKKNIIQSNLIINAKDLKESTTLKELNGDHFYKNKANPTEKNSTSNMLVFNKQMIENKDTQFLIKIDKMLASHFGNNSNPQENIKCRIETHIKKLLGLEEESENKIRNNNLYSFLFLKKQIFENSVPKKLELASINKDRNSKHLSKTKINEKNLRKEIMTNIEDKYKLHEYRNSKKTKEYVNTVINHKLNSLIENQSSKSKNNLIL